MLETMREYGQEMLDLLGETRDARDAHAAFFVSLNEWLEPNTTAPGITLDDRLREIAPEQPNIDAALQHLADTGDAQGALHLAANCAVAWHHLGYLPEGRRWLEYALANAPEAPTLDRGMALVGLALIRWTQVDMTMGTAESEEALEIGRTNRATRLVALSLHNLGLVELLHGRYVNAQAWAEEAYAVWKELDERSSEAMALLILCEAAFGLNDLAASRKKADEALQIFRHIGHSPGIAFCLIRLACVAERQGDKRDALRLSQEALPLLVSVGERWAVSKALVRIAKLAALHGQHDVAAMLVGATDAQLEETGSAIFPQDREHYDLSREVSRRAIGADRYDEYSAAGRSLSMADALRLAANVSLAPARRDPPNASDLSPRERDVLRLLVDGRSNAEIADALFISTRTVRSHVANILAKLDVPTRTAAASHAIRNNLV
jgi:DNA-binding CsgD family transcriptional regulator